MSRIRELEGVRGEISKIKMENENIKNKDRVRNKTSRMIEENHEENKE